MFDRRVTFLAILLSYCFGVKSVSVDMEVCSCLCGDDSGTDSTVITRNGPQSSADFYDRIRGPKGNLGRPGKPGLVGLGGIQGLPGPKGNPGRTFGDSGSRTKPAESCFHLRESDQTRSGIYTIHPTETSSPIEVYCDMESAGGGWTLVASIHENNIYGRCSDGDLWSSDQGKTSEKYPGTGNWENFNTFGKAEGATSADYKSPAYFSLQASDIMVWHVPNNVELTQASADSTLKYYTDSGFLRDYGGTLQSLYSKHFPLKMSIKPGESVNGVTSIVAAMNQSAGAIRALVPSWYNYIYDFDGATQNYIKDGGQDMFDTGNKISYRIGNNPETVVTYNVNYRNQSQGVDFLAATSHPFNAMMWIGNQGGAEETFALKVLSGTGADGSGTSRTRTGTLIIGNFTLIYHSYNVYGASDPSISEVFYYISNTRDWSSVGPQPFNKSPWTTSTDNLQHGVIASGSPQNILMGYMLLSKSSHADVGESTVRNVMNKTLSIVSLFRKIDEFNCSRLDESLVQPVLYLKGNNDQVVNGLPPVVRGQCTPGYVQFRSFTPNGIPNAFCPGVKTESCMPQSVCVGGINSMAVDEKSCGDFAGWLGLPSDTPTDGTPDGAARSLNDIDSSILLFTRKQA